ncbi:SpoIIE family protein phosphatase [Plantactinospora siamensis]|uniref:histidine kinase n=1 Tax=Plantactinospora siamensis TaxID=555372 RepID=A0ABV6NSS2_9ACTN
MSAVSGAGEDSPATEAGTGPSVPAGSVLPAEPPSLPAQPPPSEPRQSLSPSEQGPPAVAAPDRSPSSGTGDRAAAPGAGQRPPPEVPAGLRAALAEGGELGRLLADHDWAASPLGPPAGWPAGLREAVGMLLASSAQIVLFWGDDYRAIYNDAYRPTIGDKHPAALGGPAREHWAETWEVLGPLLAGVRRTGRAFHGTDHPFLLVRRGFVERVYFDISYDPIRLPDGTVGGVYCIVTETTGRVLGERRLRALAELGRQLAGITGGAELARTAARVLGDNPEDLPVSLLYLRDEETGRLTLAGSSGVDPAAVRGGFGTPPPALAAVLAGGPAATAAATDFLTAPPPEAAPQVRIEPITAGTEVAGALVLATSARLKCDDDYRTFLSLAARQLSAALTSQRAYAHERARAAELADLDRAKTNFFANVSHEFRTPLTLILGPLESALGDPALPPEYERILTAMHRNARRLLKLVNTVLDFAQLESGRTVARYRRTDLAGYTARLASTFRSATERAGLRLVVDGAPLTEPAYVDRDMWEKIVFNLLSNALKFTLEGEITVRVDAVGGAARLTVADTGIGIAESELTRIFERFHRATETGGRSHEGTGIGLALVRELVELHGGSVGVRSRPGRGSEFTVTIPLGRDHLPAERVDPGADAAVEDDEIGDPEVDEPGSGDQRSPEPLPDGRRAAGGGRILVVDDHADLRDHLSRLLGPYWEVVTAPDGRAAYEAARSTPFDLVLADVMMPRLDGVGLVQRLRAEPGTRHVPIVLLSARAGDGEAVRGLTAGADDYLVKPFSGQELIARVRSNVELGQLRGQIIQRMRALADAAVAINTARTTNDVLRAAARHAQRLVRAGRVVASVPGVRFEADGGGESPDDPSTTVPLVGTTGEQLGELRVWPGDEADPKAADAALAQLARLTGVRLENARLYETEHQIATTLQHSLLPESLPRVPGAVLAGRYLPGSTDVEVGGDWYDVLTVPGGLLALVIGDVVGKGVPAAAAMGELRNALRAYLLEGFDPGLALSRLNRLVDSAGRRTFATVACLLFDPGDGQLRYASAGHPAPLLVAPDGAVTSLYNRALGPPVGALRGTSYPTRETVLPPGARLLLYTDGLIEDRQVGIDRGMEWLHKQAATDADHVEDLITALTEPVARRARRDDVAMLALEAAEPDRLTLRLPTDATKLAVLRRRLEDFLVAHRLAEADRFDLSVAISEAAANAIEHPREPREPYIRVEVTLRGGELVATIRDSGHWRAERAAGFRGRGLALIGALADLTVQRGVAGTTVTLRRRLGERA